MGRLLAHRDARVYLAGQLLSVLGDSALWLAMGIWVKERTGSNSAAGLVFFAFIAGTCLAPLTGWLVDRVRRRPLLITVNLATGALVGLLLAGPRLWLVYPLLGVCIVWINVGAVTLLQRRTPGRLLGRVDAAANVLITVPQAASIAAGAAVIAVLDYRILLAVMAAVMLVAAGYLARVPPWPASTATADPIAASNRVQ